MERYIKVGKATAGHNALLTAKGYETRLADNKLFITASEVIEGIVDLSTEEKAKEAFTLLIAKKAVYSYKTRFIFPDGKILFSIPACTRLGAASALVTSGVKAPKAKKHNAMTDIFAMI